MRKELQRALQYTRSATLIERSNARPCWCAWPRRPWPPGGAGAAGRAGLPAAAAARPRAPRSSEQLERDRRGSRNRPDATLPQDKTNTKVLNHPNKTSNVYTGALNKHQIYYKHKTDLLRCSHRKRTLTPAGRKPRSCPEGTSSTEMFAIWL